MTARLRLLNALRLCDEAFGHPTQSGDDHQRHACDAPAEVAASGFEMPSRDAEAAIAMTGAMTLQPQFTILRTVPSTVVACWPCTACPKRGLCPEVLRPGSKWCRKVADEGSDPAQTLAQRASS